MSKPCICTLDKWDRITSVNEAWLAFLAEDGRTIPQIDSVIGTELWSVFENPTTHQVCRRLADSVRQNQKMIVVPMRCDLPHCRRFAEKIMLPIANSGVEVRIKILKREPRAVPQLFASTSPPAGELVKMCSWCHRLKASDWLEAEDAEKELNLLSAEFPPRITHGLCPDCETRVNAQIDAL